MEENDTIKRIEEEAKKSEENGRGLGMVLGLVFVGLWVTAFTSRGDFVLWKFLLSVAAAALILAFPFGVGYYLGEEMYNPLSKSKIAAIAGALFLNLLALRFFGII